MPPVEEILAQQNQVDPLVDETLNDPLVDETNANQSQVIDPLETDPLLNQEIQPGVQPPVGGTLNQNTIQHQAFASLNKENRDFKNLEKEFEAATGKKIKDYLSDAKIQQIKKQAKASGTSEEEIIQKYESQKKLAQLESENFNYRLTQIRSDSIQILANKYGWTSEQATQIGQSPTMIKFQEEGLKKGLDAETIAYMAMGKWESKFIPQANNIGKNISPNANLSNKSLNYSTRQTQNQSNLNGVPSNEDAYWESKFGADWKTKLNKK